MARGLMGAGAEIGPGELEVAEVRAGLTVVRVGGGADGFAVWPGFFPSFEGPAFVFSYFFSNEDVSGAPRDFNNS